MPSSEVTQQQPPQQQHSPLSAGPSPQNTKPSAAVTADAPAVAAAADPPASSPNGSVNGSPKRRASDSAKHSDQSKRTKKRRKVNHACVYCQRSHMTCDQQRPCGRCIKRSIGHLCHDEPREAHRRSRADSDLQQQPEQSHQPQHASDSGLATSAPAVAAAGDTANNPLTTQPAQLAQPDTNLNLATGPPASVSQSTNPPQMPPSAVQESFPLNQQSFYSYNDWGSGAQNSISDMHFHPNYMFNTSELSNEYSLLNDFLNNSILDDALDDSVYQANASQQQDPQHSSQQQQPSSHQQQQQQQPTPQSMYSSSMPVGSATTPNGMFAVSPAPGASSSYLPPPPGSTPTPKPSGGTSANAAAAAANEKAREKYFMTAADPTGTDSPEDRMNRLLQAKYDAGLLKPYNYPKGYQKLQDWMAKNVQPASKERIVYQFNKFRPKFRQRIQKLTDMELVLVEMWFERKLMEYDRIFASMAIPACCWRRTGEIFRGNREMSELIQVPREELRDGKLALYDILTEDSLVIYWEKFTDIAFDDTQKAILTSCSLKPPASEPPGQALRCCFSFTVNRDVHGVPTLIVGNFLPVTPPNS